MTRENHFIALSIGLLIAVLYGGSLSFADSNPVSCGLNAAMALAQAMGLEITEDKKRELTKDFPNLQMSLFEVQKAAASFGIELIGVKANLMDLLAMQRYAIIHLSGAGANDPRYEHFLLLLDSVPDSSQNESHAVRLLGSPNSRVLVLLSTEIEKRFDGYALILKEGPSFDCPRIDFDQMDHSFGVLGVGQRVQYDYRFTNTGAKDLVISVSGST